jgi:ABC-type Na+ transport system ATPase subunit NatA
MSLTECLWIRIIHFLTQWVVMIQAMVSNSSIILLDLSGNGVSIDTCTVLAELMLVRE